MQKIHGPTEARKTGSYSSHFKLHKIVIGEEFVLPMGLHGLCAGFPSPADDYLDEGIDLLRLISPNPPATFLWRVDGHSMEGAGIYHNDILIVDRSLKAVHGDVVVAIVNGERSLKRFHQTKAGPKLSCENPDFLSFELPEVADIEIWGVVRCNIHWLGERKA